MTLETEVLGRGMHVWSRITATAADGTVLARGSYFPKERSAYLWLPGDKTRGTPLRNLSIEELRTAVQEAATNVGSFSKLTPALQAAVNAYDEARRSAHGRVGEQPMSDANKANIAPMIMAAIKAYQDA